MKKLLTFALLSILILSSCNIPKYYQYHVKPHCPEYQIKSNQIQIPE